MIELDGSYGEGGGQILRTALSLASVTGRPFRIYNLRAARRRPGLRPQHMACARSAAAMTGAALEGCEEGSRTLVYRPGAIKPGRYSFDTGTAGSVTLIFQTVLPVLAFSGGASFVSLKGGTHVPWSPPADYIEGVFLSALSGMGINARVRAVLRGYYPAGGGLLEADIQTAAAPLKPFGCKDRGPLLRLLVSSTVSNLPVSIAERQLQAATGLLSGYARALMPETREAAAATKGTSVFILAEFERARAGFCALGALGKKAEEVGREAAVSFLEYMATDGALDANLSDQMPLYMALAAGRSVFTTSRITGHLLTNIHTIEAFLPIRYKVDGAPGGPGTVAVDGAGVASPGA